MISDMVIPGYPYEGAFYWFLGGSGGIRNSITHPYYKLLYGKKPDDISIRAAGLLCLFDHINLASADHYLPDLESSRTDNGYFHPDLRITVDFTEHEWTPENRAIAEVVLKKISLRKLLNSNPLLKNNRQLQEHFMCRMALQIRKSAKTGAVIVGNDFYRRVYQYVAPWITELVRRDEPNIPGPSSIALSEQVIHLTGLEFAPAHLDSFAAIRESKEISQYATSFRSAIANANAKADLEETLLKLMAEAMGHESVSKAASGAFQTFGSVMNIVGTIPVLGNIAAIADAGADVAERISTRQTNTYQWYLLGSRMREVALRDLLEKKR